MNRHEQDPVISRRAMETGKPIMQVMKSLERPPGTIDLSQGIPFFSPPSDAIRSAMEEISQLDRYGPDPGDPELRDEIIKKLSGYNGINGLKRENVMVTGGANMGFFNAISAICDVGDEVLLMDPYYFNHGMTLDILGVRHIHTRANLFSMDDVESSITKRTKAVVMVSPNNPTGEIADQSFVRDLVHLCRSRNIWLISDETYDMFTYDAPHLSPASIDIDAPVISLFSMSKAFGMSGYRIGYMAYPEYLFDPLLKVQDTTVICPSRFGQRLAYHCLKDHSKYTMSKIRQFDSMRVLIIDWLKENEEYLTAYDPSGAFYCFFSINENIRGGKKSMLLARNILEEARVLTVPGWPFGSDTPPYIRLSYGNVDHEDLIEALDRLADWLRDASDDRDLHR